MKKDLKDKSKSVDASLDKSASDFSEFENKFASAFSGKRILVTGGAGAIGSNLVKELSKYSCTIIVLDDLSSGYRDLLDDVLADKKNIGKNAKANIKMNVKANIEFIKGSILDDKILDGLFSKKVDVIFHLAALFANQNSVDHPDKDLLVNGVGTLKLLEYARKSNVGKGVERFVFTSSSCVYGNLPEPASEDSSKLHPDTPYAITKVLGERYVSFFHEHYGLKTVTFRVFNSFGPGEKPGHYRNVVPNFFAMAIRKEPLPIYGTGEETRDFNWISNLVQAMLLSAVKNEAVGNTFNISSGKKTRIIDMAKMINKIASNKAGIKYLPRRSWDKIIDRSANIEKAKRILGYNPDVEDIEGKLRKTYDWIKGLDG